MLVVVEFPPHTHTPIHVRIWCRIIRRLTNTLGEIISVLLHLFRIMACIEKIFDGTLEHTDKVKGKAQKTLTLIDTYTKIWGKKTSAW